VSRRRNGSGAGAASTSAVRAAEPALVAPLVRRPWQLAVSSALLLAWMFFLAFMASG
jgi:hypothetical protein